MIKSLDGSVSLLTVMLIVCPTLATGADLEIIPHPQYYQAGTSSIDLSDAVIASGTSARLRLARSLLLDESRKLGVSELKVESQSRSKSVIYLVDWSGDSSLKSEVSRLLNEEDRRLLSGPFSESSGREQAYVIRIDPLARRIALVGATEQGALYAATTVLQLWRAEGGKLRIPEVYIRDYPDFRYRAAADWLLYSEVNRWAYDWGDGRTNYSQRIKRKLDFCLKYKINMVFFDGFGWKAEKTPGYSHMMRELNRYARDRGVKLVFGGYGAGNRPEIALPEHNTGKLYLNRYNYPHGTVYRCVAADTFNSNAEREELLPTLGTCRANDELMRLKTEELEEFVRSVEPGGLYIHHEDQGDFDPFQEAWRYRCNQCRKRWPNEDAKAKDGAAGALAYGYTRLLEAVTRVKNVDSDYDANKDCTVVMISPVYRLREESQQDWNNVLELWQNVISLIPSRQNLQVGFREIFFQRETGERWIDAFNTRMQSQGSSARAFVYFHGRGGGGINYLYNYPFTGTAALNAHFKGAETIYNHSGSAHQEPLQMLNGAFGWNSASPGSQSPRSYNEIKKVWSDLSTNQELPKEIFGEAGFLELACRKIYGAEAGRFMQRYFTCFEEQPSTDGLLVSHFSKRIYPLAVFFDVLEADSKFWNYSLDSYRAWLELREKEQTQAKSFGEKQETISNERWHLRLSQLWEVQKRVNRTAVGYVDSALASRPIPEARADIEYLKKCLQTGERFSGVLAGYHKLLASGKRSGLVKLVTDTRQNLQELEDYLYANFQFDTVCPLGGDLASWLEAVRKLRSHAAALSEHDAR